MSKTRVPEKIKKDVWAQYAVRLQDADIDCVYITYDVGVKKLMKIPRSGLIVFSYQTTLT